MSNSLQIKVINGFYRDRVGTILGKIPGGNFFKVEFEDKSLTALHETEFERIPNGGILHGENVDDVPVRRKQK